MSIIITGLKMPTERENFNLTIKYNGTVFDIETGIQVAEAYELPPHGDLIDRDEARESIKPWSPEDERNGCTFDTVKKLMHTMLDNAPTIIPASGGKEDE